VVVETRTEDGCVIEGFEEESLSILINFLSFGGGRHIIALVEKS
jgi:hypothetical protein